VKQIVFNNLQKLCDVIDTLRAPDGCLWDRQQTKESVSKYLMDEAYEVLDAIESGSSNNLKEELGDLLFQILFIAKIAEDQEEFDISHVLEDIATKMIRRHPHVFGNKKVNNVGEIKANWDTIKINEEGKKPVRASFLGSPPRSMPALLTAVNITRKAAEVGFDWDKKEHVLEKLDEEIHELKDAVQCGSRDSIKDEIGDILFTIVNLSRFLTVDPENALRATIDKFISRFAFVEQKLKERGRELSQATLREMDDLWNEAKNKSKDPE
jgi:tetrapyrrole methylase family protein/MazG family protein